MPAMRICPIVGLVAAVVACVAQSAAQEGRRTPQIEIQKKGSVTTIHTTGDGWGGVIKSIQALRGIPREKDASVIAHLTGKMDSLPPPYAYEIVRRTCQSDPDKALYLFALTSGRIRYDAYRCKDQTARAGIGATSRSLQLPECRSMLSDQEAFLRSLRRAKDAPDMFASKASPWWICSHGMEAIRAGLEKRTLVAADWLRPEAEWPAIQKRVRAQIDYTLNKHSGR